MRFNRAGNIGLFYDCLYRHPGRNRQHKPAGPKLERRSPWPQYQQTDAATVTEVLAENSTVHDDAEDYVWDSALEVPIVLNGNSISVDGAGVTVEGSTVTITSAGTYSLSGSLEDGQIIVNTMDEETVRLILNGVDLQSSTSAPIYVIEADEVVLILADNSVNSVSDGANYTLDDTLEDAPNAAVFCKADLSIAGKVR